MIEETTPPDDDPQASEVLQETSPMKEGIQAALDFTKYIVTLAGGAIAFLIPSPTQYANLMQKALCTTCVILLSICVVSGLFVFSRGSVMLAAGEYDLNDVYIKVPGLINIVSFAFSFLILAYLVADRIWSVAPPFWIPPSHIG